MFCCRSRCKLSKVKFSGFDNLSVLLMDLGVPGLRVEGGHNHVALRESPRFPVQADGSRFS